MRLRQLAAGLVIMTACTSASDKAPSDAARQGQDRPQNLIVSRTAGFSVQSPQSWAVWSYAWKTFLAPSLTPPLSVIGNGLSATSGFSIQVSEWSGYRYAAYLRLLDSELQRAKAAGASVSHRQVTVAGRLSERYRVVYPKGPSAFFGTDDQRFLRPCKACEAEYTVIRWPGSSWEIPLRFDAVAQPDTRLADYRATVDAILASLKSFDEQALGLRGYVSMGLADTSLETVTSYMEARIKGHGAERFLDGSALQAYGRNLTLYWFTSRSMVPSYQVVGRVPLGANTARFEVLLEEHCPAPHECPGRSQVEFLEVRSQEQGGLIVGVPECRRSGTALRACLFKTS
jgi:hypothetical protein